MGGPQREQWDAIVVGSGLGGLACAAYLCAAGKRTLVLESHYVAGGNSQAFRRRHKGRDYEFDVGVHYIGECGPEGLITRVLRGVGLSDRVRFQRLDPDAYSTLIFPGLTFRVPAGWDRYRARLIETFPDEAEPLGRMIDTMRTVADTGRRLLNGELSPASLFTEAPEFLTRGIRPVTEVCAEFGLSEKAMAVLVGEQGDYCVPPSRTPLVLQAGLTDHYMRGAFYPEGGGQALAASFVEAIRAYGGAVWTRSPVERIRVEAGRVTGVTLAKTGEQIDAPVVVSNADLKRTVLELVGAAHFSREIRERVEAYRMSLPLFVAYLVLDRDLAAEGVPNTNYFAWGSYDIEGIYRRLEAGEFPEEDLLYIAIASLRDPANPHLAPRGCTNLQLMTVAPRAYSFWGVEKGPADGGQYHRDLKYRRRKEEVTDRLVSSAERILPGIRDHIDWKEAASPVTQERFTRSTGGTSYGIEFACDQLPPMRLGPTTEIHGLYLCGASTPSGHGISNVIRGGVQAAARVLERDLMREVLAGDVLGDRDALPERGDDWDPWLECKRPPSRRAS